MTDVNVIYEKNNCEFPKFKDLKIGQYFYMPDSGHDCLLIKLPNVYRTKFPNAKYPGDEYNAYNISTKDLVYVKKDIRCAEVDKVEIHV